jgi:imidazolonepropionase-like amidohydrolase
MVRRRKLAEFAEIRWEEGTFTPAQVCRFLTLARTFEMGLKVSAGQRGEQHSNPGAMAMATEMGATSVNDVIDVTERDAMLLAQSQTIATLSPTVACDREAERLAPGAHVDRS